MTVERPLLFAECFRPGNRLVGKWVAEYGTPLQRGGRVFKIKNPCAIVETSRGRGRGEGGGKFDQNSEKEKKGNLK